MIDIFTYIGSRPECPVCGCPVEQTTDTPETAWYGECVYGHGHTFELDTDED